MSPLYTPGKVVLAKDYTEGDRYFSNVSLLLHGDGTNGSTTIVDSSPTPKTVTASGNAQISTAQSKFGGASIAFDGNGDYLSVAYSEAFDYGVSDFTIEAWLYSTASSVYQSIYSQRFAGNGITFRISNQNKLQFFYGDGSGALTGTATISANAWSHVALTKNSSSIYLWANGVLNGSIVNTVNLTNSSASVNIGRGLLFNDEFFNGYIDDLRITKGIARYTANFTPPTAAFADAQF